jgi:hypothetical protein
LEQAQPALEAPRQPEQARLALVLEALQRPEQAQPALEALRQPVQAQLALVLEALRLRALRQQALTCPSGCLPAALW